MRIMKKVHSNKSCRKVHSYATLVICCILYIDERGDVNLCGIAGMIDLSYDEDVLQNMMNTMKRRGPDADGVFTARECALLHSRLSVIDPEGGKQPMLLDWEGDQYCIVYNGELYNTPEVRAILRQLGHHFQGHSDTEVVLHAYAQWKDNCLERLNGIFAFAVWELREKRLFLARDRMGVKPLFYMQHEGGLLFASEIKTILCYPTVKPQIDRISIAQLMILGPGRMPGSGVFRNFFELEPGCCAWYDQGKWISHRYWKLKDAEHTQTFEETADYVRYLVLDSIKKQTVSDVPLGTFLSGGLDSSLISAICAAEFHKEGKRLHTFSVDYENNNEYFVPGKFQPDSDASYIDIMKRTIDSEHHDTLLCSQQLVDALEAAVAARDLPGMADVDSSLLLFCKEIGKFVKVGLSGECADEIFGGYPWYRDPEVRCLEGFPWAQNTKLRASLICRDVLTEKTATEFVQDLYSQTIAQTDVLPGTDPVDRRTKEMVQLNQRWFMQTLLDRKDRMSMYHGLEVRVPFCDYRIAEYLYTVPWKYKDYGNREKGLLRYAMRGVLPEQVLWRKKSPYPKTFDPAYLRLVSDRFKDIMSDPNRPIFGFINKHTLQEIENDSFLWPWYGQLMKKPQFLAYICMLDFWMRHYHVSIV